MSNASMAIVPAMPTGMEARETAEGRAIVRSAETSSSAAAEKARATIQAKFVMARQTPRDMMEFRTRLLAECRRPGFAETAIYRKPMAGGAVQGASISFALAAARCMRNIDIDVTASFEDFEKRILKVTVIDLESNVSSSKDITIEKSVERSSLKDGQVPLSSRINSKGRITYLVEATADDLLAKENATVSKTKRNLILDMIPGDIKEESLALCREVVTKKIAEDPQAHIKRMADVFMSIGVSPAEIAKYLGHDIASCVPAEVEELRWLYEGIRSREFTWKEVLDSKNSAADVVDAKTGEPMNGVNPAASKIQAKLEAKRAARDGKRSDQSQVNLKPMVAQTTQQTAKTAQTVDGATYDQATGEVLADPGSGRQPGED